METAKKAIEEFLRKTPDIGKRLKGYQAAEEWNAVADGSNKSWVTAYRGGVLIVFTENPSFGSEITFGKKKIIDELNKRAGGTVFKDIVVKIGAKRGSEATN